MRLPLGGNNARDETTDDGRMAVLGILSIGLLLFDCGRALAERNCC